LGNATYAIGGIPAYINVYTQDLFQYGFILLEEYEEEQE